MSNDKEETVNVTCAGELNDPRILNLIKHFEDKFNEKPSYFVRVPGRVNLIGEHIDYCGYGVLPMALSQDIILACKDTLDNKIHLTNVDSKYDDHLCEINDMSISNERPLWHDYVLCGIKGALDEAANNGSNGDFETNGFESNGREKHENGSTTKNGTSRHSDYLGNKFKGIKLAFSGTVPPAAGLSSSSALVSASFLSMAYYLKLNLNRQKLATLCAISERYIGTLSGGMDQAIAFLGQKGCASYIEFNPLTASAVQLPKDVIFVIAHSLQEANKAANQNYNCRVIECRLACKIIAKSQDYDWRTIDTPKQLQDALNLNFPEIIALCDKTLDRELYNRDDICEILEISQKNFVETLLTPKVKNLLFDFKLRQRALHVFNEAYRVTKFRDICLSSNENSNDDLERLGSLMRESHESLAKLYECSHENLDKMIQVGKSVGISSRLTGAGWGGCIVALCQKGREKCYMEVLKREYYSNFNKNQFLGKSLDELVFSTQPQNGAEIFVVQ